MESPFAVKDTEERDLNDEVSFQGKRILLVEDNEINQEIALEILQEAGFLMDVADDGSIAVDKVKNAKPGWYDLVLMDIQMPIMNGYEAAKKIRELDNKELSGIPIIAMTANAFDEDRKAAFDAGMDGHIAKPIDIPKLMELIRDILK